MRTIQDYLTVREAAKVLGVSPSTLRVWDRAGKLKATRNPMNGYRLYRREDLEDFLRRIAEGKGQARARRGGRR